MYVCGGCLHLDTEGGAEISSMDSGGQRCLCSPGSPLFSHTAYAGLSLPCHDCMAFPGQVGCNVCSSGSGSCGLNLLPIGCATSDSGRSSPRLGSLISVLVEGLSLHCSPAASPGFRQLRLRPRGMNLLPHALNGSLLAGFLQTS